MEGEKTKGDFEIRKGADAPADVGTVGPSGQASDRDSSETFGSQIGTQAPTVNVVVGERKGEESRPTTAVYAPRHKRVAFQVLDFIFWVGSALLLLRFSLKLVAANPDNGFVLFIYNLTERSVGIFAGIVSDIRLAESKVPYLIELSTLIAWLIFWIVYMIAKKLVTMFTTAK